MGNIVGNTVTRPVWSKYIKGREIIHYRRECSAYNLAKRICGEPVTETEYNRAYKLLDRIQRYALAEAHQWERENTYERYCNSEECKHNEDKLNKRRNALVKELGRYNVHMVNYGLYPSIIEMVDGRDRDLYALHFFN